MAGDEGTGGEKAHLTQGRRWCSVTQCAARIRPSSTIYLQRRVRMGVRMGVGQHMEGWVGVGMIGMAKGGRCGWCLREGHLVAETM